MVGVNTGHDVRPLRILSVEDNPHDVRFARMALDDSGCVYELTHVENGETAWLYLSDPNMTPPDLVILDLRLPDELNGFDILERIAMLSRRPEVIMLTGSTRREQDRARALALGARHYYEKPILWEQWERIAEDICAIRDELMRKAPGS